MAGIACLLDSSGVIAGPGELGESITERELNSKMSERGSIKSTERLAEILCAGDHVALTAPFFLKDKAFIGFYSESSRSGCLEVPLQDLPSVAKSLYLPSDKHIIVHGLKRTWEYLDIGDPDLDTKLITDTKLMGYLLDPDLGKEQGLIISNLVHLY